MSKYETTFAEFGNLYFVYVQKQNIYTKNHYFISKFIDEFGTFRLCDITTEQIDSWRIGRLNFVAAASVDREYNALRGLFQKAIEWGYLISSPATGLRKLSKFTPRYRILSADEAVKIFSAAEAINEKTYFVIRFLHDTGCRPSELRRLEWKNFSLQSGKIKFPRTKTGRPRIIYATRQILSSAVRLERPAPWVIPEWPLRGLKAVCSVIEDFTLYDLRKNFISRALSEGSNIRAVSEFVGCSPQTLLKFYASVPEEELRDIPSRACAYVNGPRQLRLLCESDDSY